MRRSVLISLEGGNNYFVLLEDKSSVNILGSFYWQLPMGIKETSFGGKLQSLLVIRHKLNYTEMFVGNNIYICYVVIYIV